MMTATTLSRILSAFYLGMLTLFSSTCLGQEVKQPIVSTTIDFLDYVFEYKNFPNDHFPLEIWEQKMAEIAAAGIKKVYLRVNVCGFTLYPTTAAVQYGNQGGWHWSWPLEAQRLINTLKRYDPVKETIRIGKKYNMAVWCWENVWDDAATIYEPLAENHRDLVKKYGRFPLMDPFFRQHPEYYWEIDPRKRITFEAIEREVVGKIINKIVFVSVPTGKPSRITPKDLTVYTSDDNINYTRYTPNFTVASTKTKDGRNMLTISGLNIKSRFVKLQHGKNWPCDNSFSMVLDNTRGYNRAYDKDGQEIYTTWTWQDKAEQVNKPLRFTQGGKAAWDYGSRGIGFATGEPEIPRYFLGICEFAIPAVKAHKLERFKELAAYPFDGFMFNLRTHSRIAIDPNNYGFNPVIRKKYQQRYGKDIYAENFDRQKWQDLKAESVDEFLRDAKKLIQGRPLYISGLKNRQPGETNRSQYEIYGNLPWHYRQWFRDGSIDGVVMLGDCFPEYFTQELTAGKPIKIGMFREMLFNNPIDKFENFMQEMSRRNIDEIELYETMVISQQKTYYRIVADYIFQQNLVREGKRNEKAK